MPREAISFGRFSDPKQDEGDSRQRQQEAYERVCERYADRCQPSQRFGFGTFFGTGESGYHGEHLSRGGSLRLLLDRLETGDIDPTRVCLVIEAFDRLGRMAPDLAIRLLSEIVRSGCPVVVDSPELWIEPADLGGSKFILIAAMVQLAHEESCQKARRGKAVWKRRRAALKDKPASTVCPRWCRHDGSRFVLIPERAAVVRRIYEEYVGGDPVRAITRRLTDEGVPPFAGKAGSVWDERAVSFILKARTVLGEHQPQEFKDVGGKRKRVNAGPAIPGYYPRVISDELWYKAQGCRSKRKGMQGAKEHYGVNLFRGLLFDARSKSPMHVKVNHGNGTHYRYLVPYRAKRDGRDWCSIPYDLVETGFYAFVKELTVAKPPAPPQLAGEIEKEEAVVREMTDRLERYNAEDDPDELISLVRKTERRRAEALARLESLRRRAADASPAENLDRLAAFTSQYEHHERAGTLDQFHEVVRNKIRDIVEEMWVLVVPKTKRQRVAVVQVMLRAGGHRWFVVRTTNQREGEITADPSPWVHPEAYLRFWKPSVEPSSGRSD